MKRNLYVMSLLAAVAFGSRGFTTATTAAEAEAGKHAAQRTATQILPASTLAYIEVPNPDDLVRLVMDHPLRKKLEGMEQYRQLLESKQFRKFRFGVEYFELEAEMTWRAALTTVAGGGVHLAYDAQTQGLAALLRSPDAAALHKLRDKVLDYLRNNDQLPPAHEYRGVQAYQTPGGGFAVIGPWLILTNNGDLGKAMIDNIIDGDPAASLAADAEFKRSRKQAWASGETSDAPGAWGFVRLGAIRDAGFLNDALRDKSNNAGAELIFGGLAEIIRDAPFLTGALRLTNDQVRLTVAAPHDPAKVAKRRRFFFSPKADAAAPRPIKPKGTALSLTFYRDIAGMFRYADELFDENTAAGIAQGESQLSLFFGGRSLTNDVLANFSPRMQIVVTRQEYEGVTPAIKLPAAAVIFQLNKADDLTRQQIKSAFNSIVGLGNVAGTQAGKPMLLLDIARHNGADILSASYLVDPQMTDKGAADIVYNASPALAVIDDYVILSSTRALAQTLVDEVKEQDNRTVPQNTLIEADGRMIVQMLRDNRAHIVAQQTLEKGPGAEAQVDLLLTALDYLDSTKLSLDFSDSTASLDLSIKLKLGESK